MKEMLAERHTGNARTVLHVGQPSYIHYHNPSSSSTLRKLRHHRTPRCLTLTSPHDVFGSRTDYSISIGQSGRGVNAFHTWSAERRGQVSHERGIYEAVQTTAQPYGVPFTSPVSPFPLYIFHFPAYSSLAQSICIKYCDNIYGSIFRIYGWLKSIFSREDCYTNNITN